MEVAFAAVLVVVVWVGAEVIVGVGQEAGVVVVRTDVGVEIVETVEAEETVEILVEDWDTNAV